VSDELNNSECPSSDPNSRRFEPDEMETNGCISEPANLVLDTGRRHSTAKSSLKMTRSSQSLDVAITVEVCDDDDVEQLDTVNGARPGTPRRTCLINIPPVTISSHVSPDDEPADRKCVVAMMSSPTSVLSSPATYSGRGSNPNLLSVSRTGTFSSGGSTRNCSRRQSSRASVVEPQDIISVDNGILK